MKRILSTKRLVILAAALLLLGPVDFSRGQIPGSSDAVNTCIAQAIRQK